MSDPVIKAVAVEPQQRNTAKGGNVIFIHGGKGWARTPNYKPEHGSIVFKLQDETEVMRIDGDGNFFIRGKKVANDVEVFDTFCEWLEGCIKNGGAYRKGMVRYGKE